MSEIDAYIAAAPAPARERLEAVREVLRRRIPTGIEAIAAALASRASGDDESVC